VNKTNLSILFVEQHATWLHKFLKN